MRPPPPDRSRLGALLRGHVAGVAAVLTAVVLTVGVPAGHRAVAEMAASSQNALLLPVGPGQDPAATDQPADATDDLAPPGDLTDELLADELLAEPALDTALASSLADGGIPATALDAYHRAADAAPGDCHLDWSLLAAIGRVESHHGEFAGAVLHSDGVSTPPILGPRLDGNGTALIRDTDGGRLDGDPTYDRAVGPMQFIPSTWAVYRRDGNGDGRADPNNIYDAAAAAAAYLCAAGGDLSTIAGRQRAVLSYNHSDAYVAEVLALAAEYAGQLPPVIETPLPIPTELPPVNPGPPPALAAENAAAATSPVAATASTLAPLPSGGPAASSSSASSSASRSSASSSAPSSSSAAATSSASPTTSSAPGTSSSPATTSSSAPGSTSSSGPSTSSSPPPSGSSVCPVDPTTKKPVTVDVTDETGAGKGAAAETDIQAAHLTRGTATTSTATARTAIAYPARLAEQARQLAADLGQTALLREADGLTNITLVLGPSDSQPLLDALHRAATSPVC